MKTMFLLRLNLVLLAALCASFLAGQTAFAASVLWSGATDDNWSTPGNWSGGTPAGNEVFFGDSDPTGTSGPSGTVNNIVNSSHTISRLSYTNLTTIGYHTTQIPLGVTLSLTNSGNTIFVNQPRINTADAQVYATVVGAGTLSLTNTAGVISIGQGSTTANTSRRATLDLSGLDTFNATLGRIILGQQTAHSNRANATLLLAKTNFIDLAQASPTTGLLLGDMSSNNGNDQTIGLGVTNVILSDSGLTIGGRKGNGVLQFNSALVSAGSGSVRFRARNGTARQAQWLVGDNSTQSGGGSFANGLVDFTIYGSVDALVDTMILGRGTAGTATIATFSQGTLKFDAGTVDVNNLLLGVLPNVNGGRCEGTVNVDGTGQLIVNNNLQLGYYLAGTSNTVSRGLLNIGAVSGGSVTVKGDVVCAGGVGNKITSFGALTLGGKLGDAVNATNTPLQTLDLWSGSLTFDRGSAGLPATPLVQVTNLNVNGTVTVSVLSTNLVTGQFPLMKYYSGLGDVGGPPGFAGLNLTLPGYVMGYLSNNTANASVDVVITNGPAPAEALTWNGNVDGNWNTNTPNWLDTTPASASYAQGDFVTFNDSATGATNVNLAFNLSPSSLTVSNEAKTYTFSGAGTIDGPVGLTKAGAGMLVLANTGTNTFTGDVIINGGTVRNSGAADRLPTGAIVTLADVSGAAFDLNNLNQTIGSLNGGGASGGNIMLGSGNLTISAGGGFAGVISGSGQLIKTNFDAGGFLTLSNANTYTGGTIIGGYTNATTLTVANPTGSGTGSGFVRVLTNGNLRIGNGGSAGSVAVTTITNDGTVRVNLNYDLTLPYTIVGEGGFEKYGTNNTVTVTGVNGYAGTTRVQEGALRLANPGGAGTGSILIANGAPAVLQLSNNVNVPNALSIANKPSASGAVPNIENVSGTNTLSGTMQLTGNGSIGWIFDATAGRLVVASTMIPPTSTSQNAQRNLYLRGDATGEWSGGITDPVGGTTNLALVKLGLGTWTLSGVNTYTGPTVVSNGTLVVNGTIANSSAVTVPGGTLGGTGAISTPVTVSAAGNLAPGDGGIGKLSVSNSLTLNGTTTMELAKTGPTATNDQVSVLNTLTLGGTLNVSLTGTVTGGEVFQLFTAGTIAPSAFSATNLPGLPGGLTWDTSDLGAGTLAITNAVSTPTAIPLNVARAGDVLTFSWTNAAFHLQSQTNTRAIGLKTNWFDYPGGGTSPVLVTNNPANEAVFFRLITP